MQNIFTAHMITIFPRLHLTRCVHLQLCGLVFTTDIDNKHEKESSARLTESEILQRSCDEMSSINSRNETKK